MVRSASGLNQVKGDINQFQVHIGSKLVQVRSGFKFESGLEWVVGFQF